MWKYASKAIAAFVSAGVGSLSIALTPMSDGGVTIVQNEYFAALALAIVAAAGVFYAPKNSNTETE